MRKYKVIAFVIGLFTLTAALMTFETLASENGKQVKAKKAPQRRQARKSNTARPASKAKKPAKPAAPAPNSVAMIETDLGVIVIEMLKSESPVTADNFIRLASKGFYNGLIFHRVISGFMIQGGDPRGDGTGGETATGESLPNEINPNSPLYKAGYKRGIVAMANRGNPESGASQFFIMHQDYPLPPHYTIFGRVVEGIDVVDKIAAVQTGTLDRPVNPVKMNRVIIQ